MVAAWRRKGIPAALILDLAGLAEGRRTYFAQNCAVIDLHRGMANVGGGLVVAIGRRGMLRIFGCSRGRGRAWSRVGEPRPSVNTYRASLLPRFLLDLAACRGRCSRTLLLDKHLSLTVPHFYSVLDNMGASNSRHSFSNTRPS